MSQTSRETIEDDDLRTPSGIPAADEGHNPDTSETNLHQPGTEPLMDPATVKAVASESDVLRGGPGRDICYVDSLDTTAGCETVVVGS